MPTATEAARSPLTWHAAGVGAVGSVLAVLVAVAAIGCGRDDGRRRPESTGDRSRSTSAVPVRTAGDLPVPRTEVAGTALGGQLVVVGGLDAQGRASDLVHFFDPATDRWQPGPRLPRALHHVGMAALGDRVWVAGGYAGAAWTSQSQVFSLGDGESSWREEPALHQARGALALAASDGRLVALGGATRAGVTASVEVLVPGEEVWKSGPPLTQAREHLAAASSGGRVYAIAGRLGSLESNLTSVESWDPQAGGPWRPEPQLIDARGGTSAAVVAGRVCVTGGEEPRGTIASVECLSPGRWEGIARLTRPRHGLAVIGLGATLHVVGGGPTPGLSVSGTHEVLDPPPKALPVPATPDEGRGDQPQRSGPARSMSTRITTRRSRSMA